MWELDETSVIFWSDLFISPESLPIAQLISRGTRTKAKSVDFLSSGLSLLSCHEIEKL